MYVMIYILFLRRKFKKLFNDRFVVCVNEIKINLLYFLDNKYEERLLEIMCELLIYIYDVIL